MHWYSHLYSTFKSAKALKPIAYENKQRMKYGYAISCQFIQIFYLFSSHQLAHTVRQSVSKSLIHRVFHPWQSVIQAHSQSVVSSLTQSLSQEVRQSGTWSCTQSVIL